MLRCRKATLIDLNSQITEKAKSREFGFFIASPFSEMTSVSKRQH